VRVRPQAPLLRLRSHRVRPETDDDLRVGDVAERAPGEAGEQQQDQVPDGDAVQLHHGGAGGAATDAQERLREQHADAGVLPERPRHRVQGKRAQKRQVVVSAVLGSRGGPFWVQVSVNISLSPAFKSELGQGTGIK
jgi:hypothetical protein